MSIINGFYDNFKSYNGPKGNLGDYRHAARLYVDNNMRLAPKFKHLYHVVFNLNVDAKSKSPLLNGVDKREINLLAKSVELPRFNLRTATVNQYNRKKIVQTGVEYVPINIEFHDDNAGLTSLFWEAYFRYYYTDSNYTEKDSAGFPSTSVDAYSKVSSGLNSAYGTSETQIYRFGLDRPNKAQNFFTSIQVFQMHPQDTKSTFTSFTLINPYIETLIHDEQAQDRSEFSSNRMTINYESVQYNRGYTTEGSAPAGFAEVHYDHIPSPLEIGSPESLLRTQGNIVGSNNSVPELKRGNYLRSAIDQQNRFYQNIKDQKLPATNINADDGIQTRSVGNINFPKTAKPSNITEAIPKTFTR